MTRQFWRRLRSWGFFVAPLTLFLAFATWRLDVPGLHYDEALEAGLPAVQLLHNQPLPILNQVAWPLFGRHLPVMVQSHIGALQVYAVLPFIRSGGATVIALRSMPVLAGALTLVAVQLFMLVVYGDVAAVWASLWLASFASFIFWSRQGIFVTVLATCLSMWGLALGAVWWRTGRPVAAGAAGGMLGLAVYAKVNAGWLLGGLLLWWAGTLLLRRSHHSPAEPTGTEQWRLQRHSLRAGGLGLLAGLSPLIWYNLQSGAATLQVVQRSSGATYLGADNRQVFHNLWVRLVQMANVIRSADHLWYLGGSFPNNWALLAVGGALLVVGASARRRGQSAWPRLLLLPVLLASVIIESCFTISALWPTHFAIAVALPAMLVGLGMATLLQWLPVGTRLGRSSRVIVLLLAGWLIVTQVWTSGRYLQAAIRSGGVSFHSASISKLSRFLST
ncbi:MAG: hypothetical protein NVSMB27_41190 [Ktedonobacteraceae bacterium]